MGYLSSTLKAFIIQKFIGSLDYFSYISYVRLRVMTESKVKEIINEVFPKIEKHYGFSKFQECTPYVETHRNIYEKYSGIEGSSGDEDSCLLSIVQC